jgi:large subunit ribosomal protein L13
MELIRSGGIRKVKTYSAKTGEIERNWWHIDATGYSPGRLATRIAVILQGKNKPVYTAHIDTGDFVVVTNVEKMNFTGRKLDQKEYGRHTGYPGGRKTTTMKEMLQKHPDRILRKAVQGMMPKNRMARQQINKLKIFSGNEHTHAAQNPQVLEV